MATLDELFGEYEAERLAKINAEDTPEARARIEQRRKEEFEKGVRLGWWTEDGEPLPQPEDAEAGEEDDEGEDE